MDFSIKDPQLKPTKETPPTPVPQIEDPTNALGLGRTLVAVEIQTKGTKEEVDPITEEPLTFGNLTHEPRIKKN